jgi:hypothetical protein
MNSDRQSDTLQSNRTREDPLRGIVVAEIGDGRCSQGLPNGVYVVIVLKQYMSNKNCLSLFYVFFQITRPFLCYLHLPS